MVHKTLPPIQPNDCGRNIPSLKSNSDPDSSIKLRKATKKSISPRQKRSTISVKSAQYFCCEFGKLNENRPAQVIWNKLSFSNFLNTLPFISTNWLDMRRDRSVLSYEFMATFKHIIWYTITNACVTVQQAFISCEKSRELAVIPVYKVAKRKNPTGRIVRALKGNFRESRRRVDRENRQSRISCPMDAQSLSAICWQAILVSKETRNALIKEQVRCVLQARWRSHTIWSCPGRGLNDIFYLHPWAE